jgi:gliding motility associated protien GldN
MQKILLLAVLTGMFCTSQVNAQIDLTPRMEARDGAWDEMRYSEKRPIDFAHVREADVIWQMRVWQFIDLNEKMNQPLYFPPTPSGNNRSLIQVILDGIANGTITPYSAVTDDFTVQILPSNEMTRDFRNRSPESQDSIIYYALMNQLGPEFDPLDVTKYYIKEDWFFDARRSVLDVRILGICPIKEDFDPVTGIYRGDIQLFWIYFPEARDEFVKAPVFNRQNDAQRMSFDDLFIRRFFNARVDKASNVHDRRIVEYYGEGMDNLIEAERFKEIIRNFEHDLWEY